MRRVSSPWRLTAILLGAVVASLGATTPAAAQLANSAWPMLQHDERHTGRSHLLGPHFPSGAPAPENVAVWNGFDKVKSSPTIAPDGTIYVGVGWSVCAINPTVSNGVMGDQWDPLDPPNPHCRRLAADASASSAAIGKDGTLYIGDRGNALNAFDRDGNLVWRYINGHEGDVKTSPVIGPESSPGANDGLIYVGFIQNFDGPGSLAAVYPGPPPPLGVGGTLKWSYTGGNFVTTSSPALDSGVVYFGDVVGWLHAVRADTGASLPGMPLRIGNQISASPVIVPPGEPHAGRIYVGSTNGLSAVNPNTRALDPTFAAGTPTPGTFTTDGMVDQTPALAADGTIYAGSKSTQLKTFYAINPDGTQKWVFGPVQTAADNGAFAVVSADGTIYVAIGKTVYALRPANGTVLWSYTVPMNIISFPAIGGDATSATGGTAILYVPSYDGNLYALSRFPITVNPSAIGLYRPSTNTYYLRNSNTYGPPDITIAAWGAPNDIPVVGDWDGNGTTTIGLYRPSTNTYYLRNSNTYGAPDITIAAWGGAGDIPVVGDWDGNGTATIGLYRPSTNTYYLRNSNTYGAPDITIAWGGAGDTPVVGDWNGGP